MEEISENMVFGEHPNSIIEALLYPVDTQNETETEKDNYVQFCL